VNSVCTAEHTESTEGVLEMVDEEDEVGEQVRELAVLGGM
jgi:hypothetical protein